MMLERCWKDAGTRLERGWNDAETMLLLKNVYSWSHGFCFHKWEPFRARSLEKQGLCSPSEEQHPKCKTEPCWSHLYLVPPLQFICTLVDRGSGGTKYPQAHKNVSGPME